MLVHVAMLLMFGTNECSSGAALAGDAALVGAVADALEQRGLETGGRCPVAVQIDPLDGALALAIEAGGAKVDRVAADPREAATIIESWVRDDVTSDLLEHALPEDVRDPIPAEPGEPYEPPKPTVVHEPRPFALSAGGVFGVAADSSTWSGVDIRGCFSVWRLCLGGRFQYSVDLGLGGDAKRLAGSRKLYGIFASADMPLVFDRLELLPGIAIGNSVLVTERELAEGEVSDDAGGLRLRGQIGISYRLDERWAARFDAAVDYAPFARKQIFESLVDDGPEDVELAGEPVTVVWLRLALELGGL